MTECPLCGAALAAGTSRCPECRLDITETYAPAPPAQPEALEPILDGIPVFPTLPPPLPELLPSDPILELPTAELVPVLPAAPSPGVPTKQLMPATVVDRAREAAEKTIPFRPTRRPPLLLLCALDDGRADGQWIRIRTPSFTIGRTEGDLLIPHDCMMSSLHASLARHSEKERYRWYLTDLKSTNGTYLKIASVVLKHGQEILIGSRRLRFDANAPAPSTPAHGEPGSAHARQAVPAPGFVPCLVEITAQGDGERFPVKNADSWIGRDASQCSVVLPNDLMVDVRHARLHRDAKERWRLDNNKSLNGIWLRVEKVPLDGPGQFQLGEQRFLVKFP